MALTWVSSPSLILNKKYPHSIHFFSKMPPFPPRFVAVKATGTERSKWVSGLGAYEDPSLLRKPLVASPLPVDNVCNGDGGREKRKKRVKEEWTDWEDQILGDTVPLVGFVRMVLHSGKYDSGDKLIPEHEKTILERVLPYHPEFEKKIGCGINYITIGFHPEFENSRCLFIVRKDGQLVDFSYWKCIKVLSSASTTIDQFQLRTYPAGPICSDIIATAQRSRDNLTKPISPGKSWTFQKCIVIIWWYCMLHSPHNIQSN